MFLGDDGVCSSTDARIAVTSADLWMGEPRGVREKHVIGVGNVSFESEQQATVLTVRVPPVLFFASGPDLGTLAPVKAFDRWDLVIAGGGDGGFEGVEHLVECVSNGAFE